MSLYTSQSLAELLPAEPLRPVGEITASAEGQAASKRLIKLCYGVLLDANPQTSRIELSRTGRLIRAERQVPYSRDPSLQLHATYGDARLEDDGLFTGEYAKLGIVEADGSEMFFNVSGTNIGKIEVHEDPFANLILDYFSNHLTDRQTTAD